MSAQQPIVIDLTACEMNAEELRAWDGLHKRTEGPQSPLWAELSRNEEAYQAFHKRWLYNYRKKQSDEDRMALGLEPYTLEQCPAPPRP